MSKLKAIITFDDSWDDEAIRNAFADNDQLPGIVSVEISSESCGKCVRQDTKESPVNAPQHSNGAEPTEIISLCVSCVKENCFQRSEIKSCPVTICAMHQAK